MAKFRHGKQLKNWKSNTPEAKPGKLRIVGGRFRGRQIEYHGDPRTRPMKDNVREALFNLVGGWVPGKAVIDLFAGTGAVGLEAISRGGIAGYPD
ncbi:RsmD family RNA methyltransferase [bacterium]|nr:RsmD family RNA methyltransferase [bacterium]